jgi:ribosome-associated toxin RatA of RatAB toxin-antitoxin module
MHAQRSVDVDAPPATIYALAQDVARWPERLPHYRFVRVLEEANGERVVVMAARRGWIPVRWLARQTLDPATPHIGFEHLSGWARGMKVSWNFERRDGRTRVTIAHEFERGGGPLVSWFDRRVIGEFFIQSIAGETLGRMKRLAEAAHD